MDTRLEEIHRAFIEAIHSLGIDARPLHQVLEGFEILEARTVESLREVQGERWLIDFRTTLARSALSAALDKRASVETAVQLFERANAVGYKNASNKLLTAGVFARICLRAGRPELAIPPLESAIADVTFIDVQSEVDYRRLLAELKSAR